jgi:hypothetical protein
MAKRKVYYNIIVESYYTGPTSGLHGDVHIRPIAGERWPQHLRVECNKDLSNTNLYELGTQFVLRATLTDRLGSGDFIYSYFGWPAIVHKRPGK